MPLHESDISWQVLRRIVHDWLGPSAELTEVKPLVGGCINTTLALFTRQGDRAVLKISPHRVNRQYEQETHQLDLLREIGLPTPRVYATHSGSLDHPVSYLLMEFVEGIDLVEAKQHCSPEQFDGLQRQLAELVLKMHERTSDCYRRLTSNDTAKRFTSWPEFYHEIYDSIWHECEKTGHLPVKCRKQIAKVHEKLPRLIAHDDCPRLVHWDIWATNVLVKENGDGHWRIAAVLDPNCKYAHHEAELAYMELFHTITPAFLRAYQQVHKLPEGYHRFRKPIYQLYPLINHVNLFGPEYVKPLLSAVERVNALV